MRVEGVGFDDIGAGIEIGFVDTANDFRLREHEEIVVAFEVARPILEPLAAIIGFHELMALDHGPHRAIENKNPFAGGFGQGSDAFVTVHWFVLKPQHGLPGASRADGRWHKRDWRGSVCRSGIR